MRHATILALITVTAAACASDPESDPTGDPADPEALIRTTSAAAETIALSAELSRLAMAPAVAPGCAATKIDEGRVEVTLDDCGGVTGSLVVTFDDPACLDPGTTCDELGVSVDAELEIDGLQIAGRLDIEMSDAGQATSGELTVIGAGLDLAVAFDLSIADDGTCSTIDGTFEIDGAGETLSVEATGLVDCGGPCFESGILSARAGDQQVTVDFDAGVATTTDERGDAVEVPLDCGL